MKNPSFFSSLPEDAADVSRDFVEAHIIAVDFYESKPGEQPPPNEKESPPKTQEGAAETPPESREWIWTFQINPSSLRHAIGAQYQDAQTWASATPDSQFFSSSAETLEIQNAIFDTWHEGYSLTDVLQGLRQMISPSIQEGIFHPPILTFVWGEQVFGPCVLTQVSWDEVAWLGGAPATAVVNLSLKRVPDRWAEEENNNPLQIPPNTDSAEAINTTDPNAPALALTDNQKKQASQYARAHLLLNRESYSPAVQQALRSNRYLLLTDGKTGEVRMLNPDGTLIGVILRWNGNSGNADAQFQVDGVSTIPTAPGRKPRTLSIGALEGASRLIQSGQYNPFSEEFAAMVRQLEGMQ